MKPQLTWIAAALLAGLPLNYAQEALPREQALKYAFLLSVDLKQMLDTPIPTDPDVKRPVAARSGEYGGLLLPESKLTPAVLAKVDKEVTPVGQLWLRKLAPLIDGQVVPNDKLRLATVSTDEGQAQVAICTLGVRKDASGGLELWVYGKDKTPLLRTPVRSVTAAQTHPLDMAAEETSDGARVTLKIVGQYEASFMVTDPDRY
jgi:hypothetical protein